MTTYIKINNGNPVGYEDGEDTIAPMQRAERNSLLADSDKYITADFPTKKLEEWKTYRQSLRDFNFPTAEYNEEGTLITGGEEPIWPTKPE